MGKHKGSMGVSMSAFRITPKMKSQCPKDDYSLSADELEQVLYRNMQRFKNSDYHKAKYENFMKNKKIIEKILNGGVELQIA